MNPTVSIALCTYNGAQHLLEQLSSIAQQTLLPAELVVCDDGSTDETLAILDAFSRTVDFPTRIFRNPRNLGTARNFEQAISLCSGEYIALCDQDDYWMPEKLATLAEAMRGGDAGGVFSNGLLMNEHSVLTGGSLWEAHLLGDLSRNFSKDYNRDAAISVLLRNDAATGATLLFRSALRSQLGPFPSDWIHDGWIAWMLVIHSSLRALSEPLVRYRVHSVQQIGVPDYAASSKWRRKPGNAERREALYGAQLRKFEALSHHVNQHPCGNEILLQSLAAKCQHLRHRAALPKNRLRRCNTILGDAGAYRLFSRGWKSMLLDALA